MTHEELFKLVEDYGDACHQCRDDAPQILRAVQKGAAAWRDALQYYADCDFISDHSGGGFYSLEDKGDRAQDALRGIE